MLDRRQLLKSGLAVAGAVSAPWVHARTNRTLRVLGTHVTLREPIRRRAEQDLGIDISFEPGGSARVLQKAAAQPHSFDIYEQWSNSINVLWSADAIQALDIKRIQAWNEINDLTKLGQLTTDANLGKGDAPYKLLYVQPDGSLAPAQSGQISFLPYVHNCDSFGYNSTHIDAGIPYETESWGWLLDESHHGKVALINAPTIGLFDAALAAEARGLMRFNDIGNMSKQEIDRLFAILIDFKQRGHFSGFWNSVPESAEFIASGRANLASMFSPAVADLNERGIPAIYAAPREGYRAWHGVMCLSSRTTGWASDAAYEFMNWWLSGWPGAFVARQGYYISNPQTSRQYMSEEEWAYWYEGEPAATDLKGPDGRIAVRAGATRRGGSYWRRFSNIAVWNTVMNTYEYSLPRWNEFLLA